MSHFPDNPTETTLDKAAEALAAMNEVAAFIRGGDSDRATRAVEKLLALVERIVRDFGLDLGEVLPRAACSRCRRECIDYRRDGESVMCVDCIAKRVERRHSSSLLSDRERVLTLAMQAVATRPKRYGDPAPAFARVASLWSIILGRPTTSSEVALCMIALKVARLCENPHDLDGWVDVAGYGACGAEVTPP